MSRSTPVVILVLFTLAAPGAGQVETVDATDPFRAFDANSRNAAIAGSLEASVTFQLPAAMQVKRPLKLMPPKAVMVVEENKKDDAALARLDADRRAIVKEIQAARARQDAHAVSRLIRKLEDLRQARLGRIRQIAIKKVANPDAGSPAAPEDPGTAKPVLPIPTLPGKKR